MQDNTIFIGDFNSVTCVEDHLSGQLDLTSELLSGLLVQWRMVEIPGVHQKMFTYHHPSIESCKSCID